MSEVLPFPFDRLPAISAESLRVDRALMQLSSGLESQEELVERILFPLQDLLKVGMESELIRSQFSTAEELIHSIGHNAFMVNLSVQPAGQMAHVVFDPIFVKMLVARVLSGTTMTEDDLLALEMKPVTPLEEGVVQYVSLVMLEHLRGVLTGSRLQFAYDSMLRQSTSLEKWLQAKGGYVNFFVRLNVFGRDFFVRLILPLAISESAKANADDGQFETERLQQLARFECEVELSVAQVTLLPNDLEQLSEGDILLFDQASVTVNNGEILGEARLHLRDSSEGFVTALQFDQDTIHAKLTGVF